MPLCLFSSLGKKRIILASTLSRLIIYLFIVLTTMHNS